MTPSPTQLIEYARAALQDPPKAIACVPTVYARIPANPGINGMTHPQTLAIHVANAVKKIIVAVVGFVAVVQVLFRSIIPVRLLIIILEIFSIKLCWDYFL